MFNVVTNLSSVNCQRVSFALLGDQLATKEDPIVFSNGLLINTHECLNNCISYKINNKTALFLTDLKNNTSLLKDKESPSIVGYLTEINSPVSNEGIFYTPISDEKYQVIKLQPFDNYYQMVTSTYTQINENDVFRFVFQPDNTVIVQSEQNKYLLTSFFEGPGGLLFTPASAFQNFINSNVSVNQYVDAQRFDYSLGKNSITLYQIDDQNNLPRFLNAVVKLQTGSYGLSSLYYISSAISFPQEASLNFISYRENPPLNSDIKDSFLVKYQINPSTDSSVLNVDKQLLYSQNYLGMFPNEYYIQTLSGVTYPLAIHSLKNYQTPEYNYSFGFDYVSNQSGVRRIYENIFTGTNQQLGSDNVYLGYKSDTVKMEFQPNKNTIFYFGPTSESVPLSSSGLIEDGAIAGEVPFTSDRIYLKLKNYSELIPDSPQPTTIPKYSNNWLCSWLSGSMNGDKVWVDRYYNSAYYTIDQVLSTKLMKYHDKVVPTEDYIFDVPSQMILEPGALYNYFHTGSSNRLNFVNHLSASSILQITNWNSSPLKDESSYKNDGITYFNNPKNLLGEYINLDGSNHILFPATTDLLSQSKLTVSLFINVNDWNNIAGNQIFGNYYDSGFGLLNESSLTTPIITLCDNDKNLIYNINYRFSLLQTISGLNVKESSSKIIQRFPDYSYWVFDVNNRTGIKYDVTNTILYNTQTIVDIDDNKTTQNNLDSLKQIDQIELDSEKNLYIYDNSIKEYIKLDLNGNYITRGSVSNNTNRIEIDLNDKLISCFGDQSTIDNDNNIWEIVGGNLYKNKVIFGNMGYVQQLFVDAYNYLWVLNNQDTITKIDTANNSVIFSYRIGKNSSLPPDPCFDFTKKNRFMSMIRVPKDSNTNPCNINTTSTEDRVLLIDLNDDQLYTISVDGKVLTKLSLYGLTSNSQNNMLVGGDFTGYTVLRKFATVIKKFNWNLKIANPNGKNAQVISLPYDITNISKGWHNFTLTFDSQLGIVSCYLDSILVNQQTFTPNVYQLYYKYRTSLLLGCESIQNTTLNDIIGIDDGYKFVGKVAELRLYNKCLTQGEIEQIYLSSRYAANDRPIIWNMSVGDRNYIEQIKHWYKMQMPGSKSKYFNLNIHNLNIPDDIKYLIEDGIQKNLSKLAPANTSLYKINWM